jgi:hypothetical protein
MNLIAKIALLAKQKVEIVTEKANLHAARIVNQGIIAQLEVRQVQNSVTKAFIVRLGQKN